MGSCRLLVDRTTMHYPLEIIDSDLYQNNIRPPKQCPFNLILLKAII